MNDFTRPYDYAEALLEICSDALAETAAGAIDRAYVSPGLPSIDCATLAVTVLGLGEGFTSPGSPPLATGHRHIYGRLNLLGFAISIARDCVPTGDARNAPSTDDLEAAALIVTSDVWTIWERIPQAMAEGSLFEGRCFELMMDNAGALATKGGTAGFQINLRAAIGGIPRAGT